MNNEIDNRLNNNKIYAPYSYDNPNHLKFIKDLIQLGSNIPTNLFCKKNVSVHVCCTN